MLTRGPGAVNRAGGRGPSWAGARDGGTAAGGAAGAADSEVRPHRSARPRLSASWRSTSRASAMIRATTSYSAGGIAWPGGTRARMGASGDRTRGTPASRARRRIASAMAPKPAATTRGAASSAGAYRKAAAARHRRCRPPGPAPPAAGARPAPWFAPASPRRARSAADRPGPPAGWRATGSGGCWGASAVTVSPHAAGVGRVSRPRPVPPAPAPEPVPERFPRTARRAQRNPGAPPRQGAGALPKRGAGSGRRRLASP